MPISKTFELSLVIPLFNEADSVRLLFERLRTLKSELPSATEVIFVDDGSTDETVKTLESLSLPFSKKIVQLSRNFGHQAALFAGLEEARGGYTITLDGDLQHPPEMIPKMLELAHQGYDIVLTRRIDTMAISPVKKMTAFLFYKIMNFLANVSVSDNASDFRLLNRRALNALLSMPENRKFLRGMVQWIGFETVILPFTVEKRMAGKSKYSFAKMLRLAIHGITSFSTMPLFLSAIFSVFLFLAAVAYGLYAVYLKVSGAHVVEGWTSVLLVTLIIGSILSLFIALLGTYLAAIYDEVKKRPFYVIKK